jgi:hypothetical protein
MKFFVVSIGFLFNFMLGILFFYVICLWSLGIPYTIQDLGLVMFDISLDEGTGIAFLLFALIVSIIYFPVLIFVNKTLYKKLQMTKTFFCLTFSLSFFIGLILMTFLNFILL